MNYLQKFCPVHNDVFVCGESGLGVQSSGFLTRLAQFASGKSCEQFKKSCFRQCPWGSCIAMWEAKETSMIKGPKKKIKLSVCIADSYQRCWACQFRIFGCQDAEIVHWWESWKCAWWTLSPARNKNKTQKLPVSVSVCHPPWKSVKYKIRAVQQLPKVSWTEALVLIFGNLWAAARAVSLSKTCDTVTGGHCQAELSQRILLLMCFCLQNAIECAYLPVNERHTVVLRFMSWVAEIWRDRDTFGGWDVLKRGGKGRLHGTNEHGEQWE